MDFRLLVVLFAAIVPLAVGDASRGDAKDSFIYFGNPDVFEPVDYGDYETHSDAFTLVKDYETALLPLFEGDNITEKVYNYLDKTSPLTIDYMMVTFNIELAKAKKSKYIDLTNEQKRDIDNVTSVLLQAISDESGGIMISLQKIINDAVKLTDVVSERMVVDMIEYLTKAKEKGDSCSDYSGNLVAVWIEIVEAHDDSSLLNHMTNLMNIQCAMESSTCRHDTLQNKIDLISLLSTERNSKFSSEALGGMQQLEDFIQNIICKDVGLETFDELLSNLSNAGKLTFDKPENMQTFVEMQQDLLDIASIVINDEKSIIVRNSPGFIQGSDLGQAILSSYMDLADKAMSPEKADVWAKMTIEDANSQLNKLLISNEHYVGEFSGIVMKDNNNLTIDKETVTVTLSKMNLAENKSHAEFQYEGTLIKTDSLNALNASEGIDLRVYALRYKSWSQIIQEVMELHMAEIDNATSAGGKSRRVRSVDTGAESNYNKSFIGKGGVVSLSTRQDGTKKSIPVTYWVGFQNATSNSGESMAQCLSCEYLDPTTLTWQFEGCYVAEVDEYGITCKCNHTTNFAAFVMPADTQYTVTDQMEQTFRLLSIIGSSLSVLGLVVSLIIFFLVRKLVRNERLKAHTHLSIALLAVHLLFLGGEAFVRDQTLCVTMTILSHYFLLASFFWMLIEGIFLYLYVIQVFLRSKISSYNWMYFVGWGVPLVIVIITASIGIHYNAYISPVEEEACPEGTYAYNSEVKYEMCWLSSKTGIIWSFLVPAILILLFNTVIMCRTLKICVKSMRNSAAMNSRSSSYSSSAKYNSSGSEKSFESSRQYDSYNHLHGQATTDSCGYAVSTSPCLLQVMTEEEQQQAQQQNNASTNDISLKTTSTNQHERDSYHPTDSSHYHSVSGESARFSNSRTQSVVYRTSVSHPQSLQVQQQKGGKKITQLGERAQFIDDAKAAIKGAIVLLPILGVTWICGFFGHLSPVFVYLFIILNATQGVFIFIVYGLKNGEVRRAIQRRLHTRSLKSSVDAGIRRSSSATSTARSFLRFGRRRSTTVTTT